MAYVPLPWQPSHCKQNEVVRGIIVRTRTYLFDRDILARDANGFENRAPFLLENGIRALEYRVGSFELNLGNFDRGNTFEGN